MPDSAHTCLVTGASKGIGRELTTQLVARGDTVLGLARSERLLDGLGRSLNNAPGRFFPVSCDLADSTELAKVLRKVQITHGPIDTLFNNAGAGLIGPVLNTDEAGVRQAFEVNFFGATRCIQALAPAMVERGRGKIVNVVSAAAVLGLPGIGYYAATKAALVAYSEALRVELAPFGVRVVIVYPGNTRTQFHTEAYVARHHLHTVPQQALEPAVVASEILDAVAAGHEEVYTGGEHATLSALRVVRRIAPGLVQRLLERRFGVASWATDHAVDEGERGLAAGVVLHQQEEPCLYHQRPEHVVPRRIHPTHCDPELYFALYPYCLALAYGADIPQDRAYRYRTRGDRTARIRAAQVPRSEALKNLGKLALRPWWPMGRLFAQPTIQTDEGEAAFDLGHHGMLCPAAFRSLYPSAVTDPEGPWEVICPDHIKNLRFSSACRGRPSRRPCSLGQGAIFRTLHSCSQCHLPDRFSMTDAAEQIGLPCPALLSVAHGYYLALALGGELGFYADDIHSAVFQCPDPEARVTVLISRRSEQVQLEVQQVQPCGCPQSIRVGDTFSLGLDPGGLGFCLDAFNSLYLAAARATEAESRREIPCLIGSCSARWELHHD